MNSGCVGIYSSLLGSSLGLFYISALNQVSLRLKLLVVCSFKSSFNEICHVWRYCVFRHQWESGGGGGEIIKYNMIMQRYLYDFWVENQSFWH